MKRMMGIGVAAALCAAAVFGTAGCGKQKGDGGVNLQSASVQSARILIGDKPVRSGVQALSNGAGTVWVPLEDVGESMGYQTVQRNGQYVLGGTDAAYTVAMNRKEALQGDQPVLLPDPPALVNGRPYVSSASLSQLTGMQVKWDNSRSQLVLTPPAAQAGGAGVGAGTGRAAVKSSPSGTGIGTGIGTGRAAVQSAPSGTGTVKSLDVGTPDPQAIIAYAQTFMGTPYQFSSGPYDQTRTFDCSSFMQYVYGHFGVMLPRSSIQQSQVGQTVQMTDLQPGDLMFFYTPGRYDNNQTVGHVGMYMGGNQIIQTYGAPGVTISDFNDYWRGRFLFGKRVL